MRTIRIAGPELGGLNPLFDTSTRVADLARVWNDYLFDTATDGHLIPMLATEVPSTENKGISADGLAITYHLRHGVRWQDGAPFSSADVAFTWAAVMNPRNGAAYRLEFDVVREINIRDSFTFTVRLRRRYAPFVDGFLVTGICVLPKHLLHGVVGLDHAQFNTAPIGLGPYRVASYRHGERVVFIANESYWKGAPKTRRLVYQFVSDQSAALDMLRSHETDLLIDIDPERYEIVRSLHDARVFTTASAQRYQLDFNLRDPITSELAVRRALAFGTARRRLIAIFLHGLAVPSDSDHPPGSKFYDARVQRYPYDRATAAKTLERAGWRRAAGGSRSRNEQLLRITVTGVSSLPLTTSIEVQLQQEWQDIGVATEIKNYDSKLLFATAAGGGIFARGRYQVGIYPLTWTDADDSPFLACGSRPPGGFNFGGYCNPAVDRAQRVGLTTYDLIRRKAAYATIQRIVAADLPIRVLWYARRLDAANNRLRGFEPANFASPFQGADQWRL